jgi:O-antigen biosynthesis protein
LRCVSVIIPARDAVSTIEATIRSLAVDRALVREILLVDDGSSDGTADVAASAASELGLCLSVTKASFGNAGASRNAGIAKAEGDFFYFLDADDEVVAGGLTVLFECLRANPKAGLAVGGYVRRVIGRKDRKRMPEGFKRDRMANACNYLLNKIRSIAIGSALVRREVVDGIRFPETLRFDEDTFFWAAVFTRTDVTSVRRLVMIYNVVDERYMDRFTSAARIEFLNLALELRNLGTYGIEDRVLKWRKAWIARRIARAFIKVGDPLSARRFIRVAAAHPKLRRSPATLRYSIRIQLAHLRRRLEPKWGLGSVGRRSSSP